MSNITLEDLKKAFKTVGHHILLRKLNSFNLLPHSVSWFENYPNVRLQAVRTQGKTSTFLPVSGGVPQGSIVGPILFTIYINDLGKYLENSKICLYADDTALYVQGRSQVDIMLDLRLELSMVCEWLKANRHTLNAKKTEYMVFGSKHKLQHKPDLNITIDGQKSERVDVMKYLGVQLDEHLTFITHINEICSKSSKQTWNFEKVERVSES